MNDLGILILVIALFVMWDFVQWGPGSGVYPSSPKSDRMSGGEW